MNKYSPKKYKNIIFPVEFNHVTGGMIHSVISLARGLSNDYNIFIIAHKEAEIFNIGLNVNYIKLDNPFTISIKHPIKSVRTYCEIKNKIYTYNKNDTVVFTNNVGSELIFSGFGFFPIKLNRFFVSRGGNYRGKTGWLARRGFKSVDRFIAISNRQKKVLEVSGVKKSKISIIHNGVSVNFIEKEKENKSYFRLGIVGYINENKNQILGIEALGLLISKNYKVKLYIFGEAHSPSDKKYKESLIVEIENLGLSKYVVFKGFEPNQRLIFNNIDILISTSLSEGFGRTVVEAMGFCVPCIGLIESGGLSDILTHNYDGFLIKNDKHELSMVIEMLIENKKINDKITQNAKTTYENKFTEQIMCKNYINFMKENY